MKTAWAILLLICSLAGCAGLTGRAYLPPDAFLKPFDGAVSVWGWDPPPGSDVASAARVIPSLRSCMIMLPRHTDPATRQCLFLIEYGNCNGARDINRADVRDRRAPPGYEMTCASQDLSGIYAKLALAPSTKWVNIAP